MEKKMLRKEVLARRNGMPEQERVEKSFQIAQRVTAFEEFINSRIVLLYEAIRSEVETCEIYSEAKRLKKEIYYPRVLGEQMEFYRVDDTTEFDISPFGIKEPKPESTKAYQPKQEDAIFVVMPGVAFDKAGNRIGYGGGYYDKYICNLAARLPQENICKVAVIYECQLVEEGFIPKESHDVQVDYIVTEEDVYGKFI